MDIINFVLHIDSYISLFIQNFGIMTYAILFFIIFLETGFVLTPFLPGDSLLFVVGAFAAGGELNVIILLISLSIAAIFGDTVNYWIGHYIGKKIIKRNLIKEKYLVKTRSFYEKYGNKTIVLARFVPIVRTIAPFVAGLGTMQYPSFLSYNVIGGILWVLIFVLAGFFFGNIPAVQENLTLVLLIIIILSIIPAIIEYVKHKKKI